MSDKVRNLQLGGHVGFASLPDQLVNKAMQKGFAFNILCVGETGIGKSTLMDSLFNTNFDSTPSPHSLTSVNLKSNIYELQESNVQMKLNIVETVGYGDQINKEDSFKSIVEYIDQQFEAYLQEELKIKRCLPMYDDSRIHACLYFISPIGLKSIDLMCLKKLDSKVNIIPIIAKSDVMCKTELQELMLKENIVSELNANGVNIYKFPTDDETVADVNTLMNTHIPFAVVGSSDFVKVGTKTVRGRQYPWGIVQVENETHSDFVKLREMLIRTNMEDLRETTHMKLYESYRKTRLEQMRFNDVDSDSEPTSFQETCEKRRALLHEELVQKEEEIRQRFVQRAKDQESLFHEAERKLQARYDQLKEDNTKEMQKFENEENQLDDEIAEFQRLTTQHQQTAKLSSSRRHTLSLGSLGIGKKK